MAKSNNRGGFYGVDSGAASKYFNNINAKLDSLRKEGSANRLQGSVLPNRNPWIMSTTEWLERGQGIIWSCNPSEISWSIRLRQSTSKNAYSTVTHNWPNDNRGTHFDEFVLNMTFQSGNLMPYRRDTSIHKGYLDSDYANGDADTYGSDSSSISPGLVNFYDFLKLMDAPKLTSDGRRANHVVIKYNSNIFPKLTLIGQFDPEGTKFTDSSSDPNNVGSWTATFIVLDSDPRISDNTNIQSNTAMLGAYFSSMGSNRGNV